MLYWCLKHTPVIFAIKPLSSGHCVNNMRRSIILNPITYKLPPEKLACTEYLRRHKAAWVVTQPEELKPVLEKLCTDKAARTAYVETAVKLAQENHTQEKNTARFQKILFDCVKKD